MPIPIILIQSSFSGGDTTMRWLSEAGLQNGRDFIFSDETEMAETWVMPDERQLLITGTIHGDERPTVDFVKRMKERNPHLETWFFSVMRPRYGRDVYDRVIERPVDGMRYRHLAAEILKYLGR